MNHRGMFAMNSRCPIAICTSNGESMFHVNVRTYITLNCTLGRNGGRASAVLAISKSNIPTSHRLRIPFNASVNRVLDLYGTSPRTHLILKSTVANLTYTSARLPLLPKIAALLILGPRPIRLPKPYVNYNHYTTIYRTKLLPCRVMHHLRGVRCRQLHRLSTATYSNYTTYSCVYPTKQSITNRMLHTARANNAVFLG